MLWHKIQGAGSPTPITLKFHGFHYVEGALSNSVTFSSVDIGTPNPNRWIITAVGISNDNASINNVTVDTGSPVNSSFVSSIIDGNTQAMVGLTVSAITTGTTADIGVVFTGDTADTVTLGVYSLTLPDTRAGSTLSDRGVETSGTVNENVTNCEPGDVIVAVLMSAAGGSGSSADPTVNSPLTKDYDGYPALADRAVVGGSLLVTEAGTVNVTMDAKTSNFNSPAAIGFIRLLY
jgi:hypothetical protein